ncbi:amidase [Nocardioides sp. BGMRC 2183]|nr:amidase [Nocardioides sp. BGMRC 2183]
MGPTPSASGLTSVDTTAADGAVVIGINDARRPGLDTGSIRSISNSRMEGFGNLFLRVPGDARMNDQMLRGFGLAADGVGSFRSNRSVRLGDVLVTRKVDVATASATTSFFDTFTNTATDPVTIEVSFGGSLGYGTAPATAGVVTASESGDAVADAADSWIVATSEGNYRPSGVVVGDGVDALGDQQNNPFEDAYATTGSAANDIGFIHELTLGPGESTSLLQYVLVGARGDSTEIVDATAALAEAPGLDALSLDEICTIANWDVTAYADTCRGADPLALPAPADTPPGTTDIAYDVAGKTIAELQSDMSAGTVTSVEITQAYLDRIAAYDQGAWGFHAFITVADNALDQARAADAARAEGTTGDLLGIPLGIKDLYDTKDMPTTGGTKALQDWQPGTDAWQVAKLREAGAVIIGKTNLSEFANSGSWSESGFGQVWNGLYPSKSSFGSSGGSATAVATDLAAGAMGTQTGVSLYAPSTGAGLTTFRGTDGLTSTNGVMPLTWATDYAGPMAKTVTDVASLLDATATQSTGNNPDDLLTSRVDNDLRPEEWKSALAADALEGKVIGYRPESFVSTQVGDDGAGQRVLHQVRTALESAGATLIEISGSPDNPPSGDYPTTGNAGAEGWERYQAESRDVAFPYTTAELMEHPANLPYNVSSSYTREPMDDTSVENLLARRDQYKLNAGTWMETAGDEPVDAVIYPGFLSQMGNNDASSAIFSSDRGSGVITQSVGLPTVILPVGANADGQTNNVQIVGRAWDDAEVLGMGYALEQVVDAHVHSEVAPALAWSGPAESTTTATLRTTSTTYGKAAKLVVQVSAEPTATGRVSAEVDGRTVSGTVAAGRAVLSLPAKTGVGTHLVTVTYAGSARVAGSQATTTLRVTKAKPTVRTSLIANPVKSGKKAKVKVRISGVAGSSTALIYDGKRVIATRKLGARQVITLPRLAPGKHSIRVRIEANASHTAAWSKAVVLRVVRR